MENLIWIVGAVVIVLIIIWLVVGAARTTLGAAPTSLDQSHKGGGGGTFTTREVYLWTQHVGLTRSYVTEAVAGLESRESSRDLLLQNQDELGAHWATVYGKQAGDKYAALLRQHIAGADKIVGLAVNNQPVDQAVAEWRVNGQEIVALLKSYNRNVDLQEHWTKHLDLTIAEVTAIIQKRYGDGVTAFREASESMYDMAIYIGEAVTHRRRR
jgi:hypothetical protein